MSNICDKNTNMVCSWLRRHSVFLFGQRIAFDAMVF